MELNTNEIADGVHCGEAKDMPFQTDASTREQDVSSLKVQSAPKLEFHVASLLTEPGTFLA